MDTRCSLPLELEASSLCSLCMTFASTHLASQTQSRPNALTVAPARHGTAYICCPHLHALRFNHPSGDAIAHITMEAPMYCTVAVVPSRLSSNSESSQQVTAALPIATNMHALTNKRNRCWQLWSCESSLRSFISTHPQMKQPHVHSKDGCTMNAAAKLCSNA